jgi:hypothetical protein
LREPKSTKGYKANGRNRIRRKRMTRKQAKVHKYEEELYEVFY